jgi:hypothetical protein
MTNTNSTQQQDRQTQTTVPLTGNIRQYGTKDKILALRNDKGSPSSHTFDKAEPIAVAKFFYELADCDAALAKCWIEDVYNFLFGELEILCIEGPKNTGKTSLLNFLISTIRHCRLGLYENVYDVPPNDNYIYVNGIRFVFWDERTPDQLEITAMCKSIVDLGNKYVLVQTSAPEKDTFWSGNYKKMLGNAMLHVSRVPFFSTIRIAQFRDQSNGLKCIMSEGYFDKESFSQAMGECAKLAYMPKQQQSLDRVHIGHPRHEQPANVIKVKVQQWPAADSFDKPCNILVVCPDQKQGQSVAVHLYSKYLKQLCTHGHAFRRNLDAGNKMIKAFGRANTLELVGSNTEPSVLFDETKVCQPFPGYTKIVGYRSEVDGKQFYEYPQSGDTPSAILFANTGDHEQRFDKFMINMLLNNREYNRYTITVASKASEFGTLTNQHVF